MRLHRHLTPLAALAALACGTDPQAPTPPAPTNPDASVSAPICSKVPAELTAKAACLSQEHCPCGTHCELGECIARCTDDSDCGAEQRCDEIGTCRATRDPTLSLPQPTVSTVGLSIEPAQLALDASGEARPLWIGAPRTAAGRLRVVAGPDVALSCLGQADARECRFDGVPAGERHELGVRLTGPVPADEARLVWIYSDDGLQTVTVVPRAEVRRAGPLMQSGTYRGFAVASALGVVGSAPLTAGPEALSLPITARLFAADGVLELKDPLGVLHPSGALIGRVSDLGVTFPAFHLSVDRAVAGAEPEVLVASSTAALAVSGADRVTVAFELEQRYLGVATRAPVVRYRVNLTFDAALDANATAPGVPADEVLVAPLSRAAARTAWEEALDAVTGELSAVELRTAYSGRRPDVGACMSNAAEREAPTRAGLTEMFGYYGGGRHVYTYAEPDALANAPFNAERTLGAAYLPTLYQMRAQGTVATQSTVTISPATREVASGDLPCAFRLPELSTTWHMVGNAPDCGGRVPTTPNYRPEVVVDDCGSFEAEYDCEIVTPEPINGQPPALLLRHTMAVTWSGVTRFDCNFEASGDFFTEVPIERVCRLRDTPRACAATVTCEDDADQATPSSNLGDRRLSPTGDLACLAGTHAMTIELDRSSADRTAAQLLETCIADLDRIAADPAVTDLASALDGSGCVGPRLVTALDLALSWARRRATEGRALPASADDALAHRLIQRWLDVHQLLARESLQAERLATVVRRVSPNDDALPPPIDRVLDRSLRGVGLLLHPRWADALASLPDEVLASPDYRAYFEAVTPAPNPNHEQPLGLAATLEETLTAQLALTRLRLERARYAPDPRAVADSGRTLRTILVAASQAADLRARAEAAALARGAPLTWAVRADASHGELLAALVGVIDEADKLVRGRNPLGIEDSDLPLYFFGSAPGAGERFAAISDYLIGAGGSPTQGWAPQAVAQANAALTDARAAWTAFTQRRLQREIAQGDLDKQIDAVSFEFGDKVADYCSAPDTLPTAGIIEHWEEHHGRPFSASNCFMRLDEAKCQLDLGKYARLLRAEDLAYQLCVARRLQARTHTPIAFTDPAWAAAMNCNDDAPRFPTACADGVRACALCSTGSIDVPFDVRQAPQQLGAVTRARVAPALLAEVQASCAQTYRGAAVQLPSLSQVTPEDYDLGKCYRGQLGEQALTIRAAAKDIEIARAELAEHTAGYDIAMRSCIIRQRGDTEKRAAQQAHDRTMRGLNIAKAVVDAAAASASAGKDCATALGNENKVGSTAAFACTFAAIESAATIASIALQTTMDELERSHEATLTAIEAETNADVCFNDVGQFKVGIAADTLRVQRALQDIEVALYQFNEMQIAADTYYADGQAALAVLRERTIIPPSHDFWLDEKLRTFTRQMSYAQRLTYLGVRAVEYEFQQSTGLTARVLAAAIPDDLRAVLEELNTIAGTRAIGARPSELKKVFSLRRELFQLPVGVAPGGLDPFKTRVQDPRWRVYGPDGAPLGVAIPFTLTPDDLSSNDCAERVWSVSANLIGGSGVIQGLAPTVRMDVRKKNTFYSRWCGGTHDEAQQVASVRPTRNLLRGASSGDLGLERGVDDFTAARVETWANVPASDFFQDDYANGDTSELAARGLFGDYELFIPEANISQLTGAGRSDGVVLDRLEDVLIRFDYVSIGR